jgi:hypothetical protein
VGFVTARAVADRVPVRDAGGNSCSTHALMVRSPCFALQGRRSFFDGQDASFAGPEGDYREVAWSPVTTPSQPIGTAGARDAAVGRVTRRFVLHRLETERGAVASGAGATTAFLRLGW